MFNDWRNNNMALFQDEFYHAEDSNSYGRQCQDHEKVSANQYFMDDELQFLFMNAVFKKKKI